MPNASIMSKKNSEKMKLFIIAQQKRLCLLLHALKCDAFGGYCKFTPYCSVMKEMLPHIIECKNKDCDVVHCVSTRYVWNHYKKCKDNSCEVCTNVKERLSKYK